jgi:hypothetical protein
MNRLYAFLVFALLLSFTTLAQTDPGTWLLGLSGNAAFKGAEQSRTTNLQAAPLIGYFVDKNWVVGTQLTLDHERRKFMDKLNYKAQSTSLHAISRYYIGDWKARPFLQVMTGYNWNRALVPDSNGQLVKYRGDEGWNASLGAGLAYFVAPKVALEADANYRHHFSSDLGRRNNRAVTLRLGLSLYLR